MAKIKFCGMTNLDDCRAAIDLSVDIVGFVFYGKSPRYIMPQRAEKIVNRIGTEVETVGVFVEEDDREIARIMDYCGLDYAQVYRPSALPRKISAYRISDRLPDKVDSGLVLFDRYSEGFGGSGLSFDFTLLGASPHMDSAFIAGGINGSNVQSVLCFNPFGVDVASGVEAYPGKKDYRKMEVFVEKVRGYVT